jgi:hypothetical protein
MQQPTVNLYVISLNKHVSIVCLLDSKLVFLVPRQLLRLFLSLCLNVKKFSPRNEKSAKQVLFQPKQDKFDSNNENTVLRSEKTPPTYIKLKLATPTKVEQLKY